MQYEKVELPNGGIYYKKVETDAEVKDRTKKEKMRAKLNDLKGLDKGNTVASLAKRVEVLEAMLDEFLNGGS
jgi:hypothetical protein